MKKVAYVLNDMILEVILDDMSEAQLRLAMLKNAYYEKHRHGFTSVSDFAYRCNWNIHSTAYNLSASDS